MKIEFIELVPTIKLAHDAKHPDLLAYSSVKLADKHNRQLIINGFTVRKSKRNEKPYLVPPSKSLGLGKGFFRYTEIDKSLWAEIEKEIVNAYEYAKIPIVEDS